jgi:hypothetical protein
MLYIENSFVRLFYNGIYGFIYFNYHWSICDFVINIIIFLRLFGDLMNKKANLLTFPSIIIISLSVVVLIIISLLKNINITRLQPYLLLLLPL